jgi:hypothetical protein
MTNNFTVHDLWTKEAIICAIRRWVDFYGEPPTSKTWKTAIDTYPSTWMVRTVFGSWNKGIRAAGYRPRPRGNPGHLDPIGTMEKVNAGRSR